MKVYIEAVNELLLNKLEFKAVHNFNIPTINYVIYAI